MDKKKPSIWVAGDSMIDVSRFVTYQRPSPEDPACPVGVDERREHTLGGAANVARWVRGLLPTHEVLLVSPWPVVDLCESNLLEDAGITLSWILEGQDGTSTIKERVYLGLGGSWKQVVRIDQDTDLELTEHQAQYLVTELRGYLRHNAPPSALVVADYGKGMFTGPHVPLLQRHLAAFADEFRVPVVVNSKYPAAWRNFPADVFVCNEKEQEESGVATWINFTSRHIIWTKGAQGASIIGPNQGGLNLPSLAAEVVDVTGAGDAFLAGLTACFVEDQWLRGFHCGSDEMQRLLGAGQRTAAHCVAQYSCGKPGKIP